MFKALEGMPFDAVQYFLNGAIGIIRVEDAFPRFKIVERTR
jgi:hypothetical protein